MDEKELAQNASTEGETLTTSPTPDVNTVAVSSRAPRTRRTLYLALAILIIGAVAAGGYYFLGSKNAEGGPVAIVNGLKIARDEFNSSVELITQTALLQGANVTDPTVQTAINEQALDILVNNTLLIEAAREEGITVSQEKIDSEYQGLITEHGGEEELAARMEEVGLTEKKLRSNIEEKFLVDAYIEAVTDVENVTVSEDEVKELYDSANTGETALPPLEEIRPQVEEQIRGQKRQTIVNELILKLRNEATIEVKL
jgi:peptidyl-prolyl cis-trans isomerase SurA